MSDVMLHGVLNMPPNLWSDSPIDIAQRHGRYIEASKRIRELENELSEARKQCDTLVEAANEYMKHHMWRGFVTTAEIRKLEQALATVEGTSR